METRTYPNQTREQIYKTSLHVGMLNGVQCTIEHPDDENLLYVALTNGRSFKDPDAPSPLSSDGRWPEYDPDGVFWEILSTGAEPQNMTTDTDGVVWYSVVLLPEEGSEYTSFPFSGKIDGLETNSVVISARPTPTERMKAYIEREFRDRDPEPEDVLDLVEEVMSHVKHVQKGAVREALIDHFGLDEQEVPYGDLRDLSEAEQEEYWEAKNALHDAHERLRDILAEHDPERSSYHAQQCLLIGADLQFDPKNQ